jgi:tRNA (cytidine/uridine-2'-O-)-methyltransferase
VAGVSAPGGPSRGRLRAAAAVDVILVEPEIPPNTGNVARTCAAVGARLHLVEPLGFFLDDRHLRRAGVDYWDAVEVVVHPSWEDLPAPFKDPARLHLFTGRGGVRYDRVRYTPDAVLVFGRESTGLPEAILQAYPAAWRCIPMRPAVRSLNLANAVAVAVYEAWRQQAFVGAARMGREPPPYTADDKDRPFLPEGG